MPENFDFDYDCSLTEDAAMALAEADDDGLEAFGYEDEAVAYA